MNLPIKRPRVVRFTFLTRNSHNNMRQFTFEELPNVIGELFAKIDNIEKLLQENKANIIVPEDEPLTISEAAKLLRLSVATIYTKVCKNEIPANKQGKRLYFYRSELLNWIKSGRIKTITEIQHEAEIKFSSKKHFK